MTWNTSQGNQKTTEDQMKATSFLTDYFFTEEGKFKLISNITGSCVLETHKGIWKLAGNKLVTTLKQENR